MSKLIISKMDISGQPCMICARTEEQHIMELQLEPDGKESILNNIYVGQVDKIAPNIQAAFVRFGEGQMGYFPLAEENTVIYSASRTGNAPLRPGDEILVQVRQDAMKGKLPALTSNLNFTGKYLVITTGEKRIGFSGKLTKEEKGFLGRWLEEGMDSISLSNTDRPYGIIIRTNAAQASRDAFLREYQYLHYLYDKTAVKGRNRTCGSLLYRSEPFYLNAVRDVYHSELEEIVTDQPQAENMIREYLSAVCPQEIGRLRFYDDKLLPLHKLYRVETAIDEICREKIWLSSGGFLVIQQTEAFVSIDVNSGKYTGRKKAQETYRKINLEAAREIARQLRLRNLSGIILIDFINMENPDHQEELFHILQKYLRKDSVKAKAVDITPLHILEMTRQKVRRPVIEDLRDLTENKRTAGNL